jgi:hypothetical protein
MSNFEYVLLSESKYAKKGLFMMKKPSFEFYIAEKWTK